MILLQTHEATGSSKNPNLEPGALGLNPRPSPTLASLQPNNQATQAISLTSPWLSFLAYNMRVILVPTS